MCLATSALLALIVKSTSLHLFVIDFVKPLLALKASLEALIASAFALQAFISAFQSVAFS